MWDLFNQIPKVCINLIHRKDNRKHMDRLVKKKNIKNFRYYKTKKHSNPKRGCLESHLAVIKMALEKKWKYVAIFEDDVKFWKPLHELDNPPNDWDMLYLGGTVRTIFGSNTNLNETIPEHSWIRMACWTTHAYILNLENEELVSEIMSASEQEKEIDTFYSERIHPKFNCYMYNPMIFIQKPGYSEIEGREVSYDFMAETIRGFKKPAHRVDEEGNYVLQIGDVQDPLPRVSIITPTKNRRHLFSIAIRNFMTQEYPKELMEWIILDDSTDEESIQDLFPNDKRIKYVNLREVQDREYTIAHKRNIGADLAEGDIVVHMDDDDYYPPQSVMSRVRVLQKYSKEGFGCVGCSVVGSHDLVNQKSTLISDGPLGMSEASMAYFKKFWETKKWDSTQERGEYRGFLGNRTHQVIDMPYSFIIIALNHGGNFTERSSRTQAQNSSGQHVNFIDTLDEETQFFIMQLTNSNKQRLSRLNNSDLENEVII